MGMFLASGTIKALNAKTIKPYLRITYTPSNKDSVLTLLDETGYEYKSYPEHVNIKVNTIEMFSDLTSMLSWNRDTKKALVKGFFSVTGTVEDRVILLLPHTFLS